MVALSASGLTRWSESLVGAAANDDVPAAREVTVFLTGFPAPRLWTDRVEAMSFLLDRAIECLRAGQVPPAIATTRLTADEHRACRMRMTFEDLEEIINGRGCAPGLWIEVPWQWVRGRAAVALPPEVAALGDADLRRLLSSLVQAAT